MDKEDYKLQTQISAHISSETKKLVEEYIQAKGVKEAILIETALLHHLQALKELPDDIIVPPRISVSEESVNKIMEPFDNPTIAMKSLFENDNKPVTKYNNKKR